MDHVIKSKLHYKLQIKQKLTMLEDNETAPSSLNTRHADAECVKSADYPQKDVCAVLQEWVRVKFLSVRLGVPSSLR